MAGRDPVEVAAEVVARLVPQYRGRGLDDEALVAAATRGVERAIDGFDPTSGARFETFCAWWARQALTRALAAAVPPREQDAAPMCPGDLVGEVRAHAARARLDDLWQRHRAALGDLLDPAPRTRADVPDLVLAFYDLFVARYDAVIRPWLAAHLEAEAARTNAVVGDDEQRDYGDFAPMGLSFPDLAHGRWELVVEIEDSDTMAFFELDGWSLHALGCGD